MHLNYDGASVTGMKQSNTSITIMSFYIFYKDDVNRSLYVFKKYCHRTFQVAAV
jgi:hypothetical protein